MEIIGYIVLGIFGFMQFILFNNWLVGITNLNKEKQLLINKISTVVDTFVFDLLKQKRIVDEFEELSKKGDRG